MHILREEERQPGGDKRPHYCLWGAWADPILSALPLLLPGLSAHLRFDYAGANPALGLAAAASALLSHTLAPSGLRLAVVTTLLQKSQRAQFIQRATWKEKEQTGSLFPSGLCSAAASEPLSPQQSARGIKAAETDPPRLCIGPAAPGRAITSGFVTENVVKNKTL